MSDQSTNGQAATGRALLSASWAMLRKDRSMLWLPAMAAVFGLAAAAVLFAPGFALGWWIGGHNETWGAYVGSAFAVFALSVVAIYFQAALVIGANKRADDLDPTLSGVLADAWRIRARILKWAVVTTIVGLVLRIIEERLGFLGSLISFLGDVAWAIASFLVVPILVVEDIGPIDAVKQSAHLVKKTWGTSVRTTLRFGLVQIVLLIPAGVVLAVGIFLILDRSATGVILGVVLVVIGAVALLAMMLVFNAISVYSRALIYRYATGRPVPGIDPSVFVGVFSQKKRNWFSAS